MGGLITEESIDRVLRSTDLVDLAQGYTTLRRSGGEWLGRCPFHDERTPSFWVNPDKGLYHCFGCGASGNTLTFVQDKLALDFPDAMEYLADRARVELEYEQADDTPRDRDRRPKRVRLQELLETATGFFSAYLERSDDAAHAREYLQERRVTPEAVAAFRIGMAPDSPNAVVKRARAKGFTDDELRSAGLVTSKGTDLFRGRVVFPIRDRADRVVGFGGRKLREDDFGGKYVNSPEGPLFDKSATLYLAPGLRDAARNAGSVIVAEGYLDVVGMWQVGLGHCCAVMGTAVTERTLRELRRYAERIYVAFDPDGSGRQATIRNFAKMGDEVAGLDIRVVELPEGEDPFDVATSDGGRERLDALLEAAQPLLTFRVSSLLAAADLESAPGRNEAWRWAQAVIGSVPPTPERGDQVERLADRLGLQRSMTEQLHRLGSSPGPPLLRADTGSGGSRRGRKPWRGDRDRRERMAPDPPMAPRRQRTLPPAEQEERRYLAARLALSAAGHEVPETDPHVGSEHFAGELHRTALAALESSDGNPIDNIRVRSDSGLIRLFAELTAVGDRDGLGENPAQARRNLTEFALRLEANRLDRAITGLKAALQGADIDPEPMAELTELTARKKDVEARWSALRDAIEE